MTNVKSMFAAILAIVLIMAYHGTASATRMETAPAVEYEISEGNFLFIFKGIDPSDIMDVTWNGESIYENMLDVMATDLKYTEDGFSVRFNEQLSLEGPGVIEVILVNGKKLHKAILSGPLPSLELLSPQASCSEAPGIYGVVQCDSVKSDVGTPPYPCCDNNSNNVATDPSDGNCTWYAWYKAKKVKGWVVPSNWGNGGSWCANAAKAGSGGWKVSSTAAKNTIACSSSIGHVAWVTDVSADKKTITVEEMNCKVSPSCVGTGLRTKSYSAASFQYISK